jgi:hypothetical protein
VEPSISVSRKVTAPFGSFRCGCSCALTKPMGTIPCFLLALSSRMRALSRAPSSSKATWLNRARAFRTCAASWIGRRRLPRESMYANALSGSSARSFAPSGGMPGWYDDGARDRAAQDAKPARRAGFGSTERRRSRTERAVGCTTALVLKIRPARLNQAVCKVCGTVGGTVPARRPRGSGFSCKLGGPQSGRSWQRSDPTRRRPAFGSPAGQLPPLFECEKVAAAGSRWPERRTHPWAASSS